MAAAIRKGGRSGPAVEPGHAEKSLLIARVSAADEGERMPPEGKPLTERQVALLRAWVGQGAPAPADERPDEDPHKHWAYQPPVRPPVPAVRDAAWVRNPIDAFVAAGYEKHGLGPAGPADRSVLLRRVYLDLIGLPPTRDELRAFLADDSPDAYEKVVDRLLASPRYAERWARHWMDVWRYSDWYGSRFINQLRNGRRHIWRWRDWLIESLEKDGGYDRMVREMLAGDELAPGDADVQRAGGYLGRNFYVFNRHVWLQDTVEYTGTALLGITFKCCRCHDHKYDPISQEDYYRFRAFFEPHGARTDPIPGKREPLKGSIADGSPPGSNLKEGCDCVYDADLGAPTYLLERGNEKNPVKDRVIRPGLPAVLGPGELRIEPVALPAEVFYPDLRPAMRADMLREARTAVQRAEADLAKARGALAEKQAAAARAWLASLEARIAAEVARYTRPAGPQVQALALAAGKAEREAQVRQAEVEVLQAEHQLAGARSAGKPDEAKSAAAGKKLAELQAKLAQARKAAAEPAASYTPLGPVYPRTSSGRRLALARWITSRHNPLTARVAVNHVWLRHMGSALVPSVSNFGLNGKRPTHPELLDYLAVEFMERGWSTKALHRLIVTSNTYRLGSSIADCGLRIADSNAFNPQSAIRNPQSIDPENRFLWRANVRRMEAEVVRDSLLHLSGRLDVARGGEDIDPTLDPVVPRRSLYFRHTPDEKPLLLELFDAANPSECFERTESIVPQQALALANSTFSHSQARLIARKLVRPGSSPQELSDADFVTAAFEHVLARAPVGEERAGCEAFLRRHAALLGARRGLTANPDAVEQSGVPPSADPHVRAREILVHVLLNYNEFVTIR
jgi:hypothetical protein